MHVLMHIFLMQVYFTFYDTNNDFNPAVLLIITFFQEVSLSSSTYYPTLYCWPTRICTITNNHGADALTDPRFTRYAASSQFVVEEGKGYMKSDSYRFCPCTFFTDQHKLMDSSYTNMYFFLENFSNGCNTLYPKRSTAILKVAVHVSVSLLSVLIIFRLATAVECQCAKRK